MSLLLNSVTVSDTTSKYFNSRVNILIDSKGYIKKISKTGINRISVGAVTHSAKSFDSSLLIL